MKPIMICAIALLVLASSAIAVDTATVRNDLDARYLHLSCRAQLVTAQEGILAKIVNTTPSAATITANMAKLKEYAEANDVKGFNTYVRTTLMTSFKTFGSKLLTARNEWKSMNFSRRERAKELAQAATDWKAATAAFSNCNKQAQYQIVQIREGQITSAIENWQAVLADMKAKGLNTTAEEAVLADAEQLKTMLQEAKKITDEEEFNAKIEEIRQLHLHLWARFYIARIESHLQYLEPNATTDKQKELVGQIKSMLASSKHITSKGNKYAEGEFEQIWQNIYQAGEKVKALGKSIKGGAQ
jgi:hypothetical protein